MAICSCSARVIFQESVQWSNTNDGHIDHYFENYVLQRKQSAKELQVNAEVASNYMTSIATATTLPLCRKNDGNATEHDLRRSKHPE